jgi:Secretion system C-terminal sorting domain
LNPAAGYFVFTSSGTIFVVTQNGLFRSVQPTTSVRELSAEAPMRFSLEQNFPNPFNPTTNISFSLSSRSFVSLKVYDLKGREVATVVSEEMSEGNYAKQWNARNLPSGIYFYRLQAGSFKETKKLLLLK